MRVVVTRPRDQARPLVERLAELGAEVAECPLIEIERTSDAPVDASGYDAVYLTYHRWLSVEDAAYDQASVAIGTTPIWSNASGPSRHLDHVDREWRLAVHDVTPYAQAPLVVTWSLVSDASREFGGWNLDDVCIVGIGGPPPCGDCDVHHDSGCAAGGGDIGSCVLGFLALGLARKRRRAYPFDHYRCRLVAPAAA